MRRTKHFTVMVTTCTYLITYSACRASVSYHFPGEDIVANFNRLLGDIDGCDWKRRPQTASYTAQADDEFWSSRSTAHVLEKPLFTCSIQEVSCALCRCARFGNTGGGITRLLRRVRRRSRRLPISMARAARVDVPRAVCRGRGGERRDRDGGDGRDGKGGGVGDPGTLGRLHAVHVAFLNKNSIVPVSMGGTLFYCVPS